MSESVLMREIMKAVSATGARVFRNNVAQAWVGVVVNTYDTNSGREIVLRNMRPLHAGLCVGSSDLIGFTSNGRFLAIETKSKRGNASAEQANFLRAVNLAGGVGFVARSVEEALQKLHESGLADRKPKEEKK